MLAFGTGPWEIFLILGVFLLLFGGRKLPELARSMGTSITEFKRGLRQENEALKGPETPEETKESGREDP